MSTTTKVDIPIGNTPEMVELMENIIREHQRLGNESPLLSVSGLDMTDFAEKVEAFKQNREQAQRLFAESQAIMQRARLIMGVDAGQNVHTQGTLYFLTHRIKQYLLFRYSSSEESLSRFGFNVVIKVVKKGRKKKKVE